MNYLYWALLSLLLNTAQSWGQTLTDVSLKHTPGLPPPPEAAALGKFGQTPVSLYTGVPQISIPLYTLPVPNAPVPISLAYHAGGIRASELASNVGLGWALQAGGLVSSTAFGQPDFSLRGYVRQGQLNKLPENRPLQPILLMDPVSGYTNRNPTPDYTLAMRLVGAPDAGSGLPYTYGYDSQPDVFHYTLAGRSGQFFHTQDGTAHPMPFAPLRIQRQPGNLVTWETGGGYTITDEKGTVFRFDQPEVATTTVIKYGSPLNPTDDPVSRSVVYHLSRIETVKGDVVTFTYDTLTYRYHNITSRSRFQKLPQNYCAPRANTYTESSSVVHSLILREIRSSLGHRVRFEYGTCRRQDLAGSRALTAVVVEEGASTRRFELQYGYFGTDPAATLCSLPAALTTYHPQQNQYRLKLQAVQEVGKPATRLTYLTDRLPDRLNAGEDHWGFLNGSSAQQFPLDLANGFTDGASKEPDSTAMVQGMLRELHYPTGGFTRFVFEPNGYRISSDSVLTYVTQSVAAYATDREDETGPYQVELPFTIRSHPAAPFNPASVRVQFATPPCGAASPQYTARVFYNGAPIAQYCGSSPPEGLTGNAGGGPPAGYNPGNYQVRIEKAGNVGDSYFRLLWTEAVMRPRPGRRQLTGGLRIREAVDFDGVHAAPAQRKRYYYSPLGDTTANSGVTLGSVPTYTTTTTEYVRGNKETPLAVTGTCSFLLQTTNSQLPLSTIQGNNMAYPSVVVLADRNGQAGLAHYRFSFARDYQPSAGYPFTPPTSHEWERGLPLEETEFIYHPARRIFSPVRRVRTHYTTHYTAPTVLGEESANYTPAEQVNETHALGLNLLQATPELFSPGTYAEARQYVPATFHVQAYKLLSVWQYANAKEEYTFDAQDSTRYQMVRTTFTYANPRHAQLTASTRTSSGEEALTTRLVYPLDLDTTVVRTPPAAAVRYLARTHQLAVPLETQTVRQTPTGAWVVSGELLEYEGKWPRRIRQLHTSRPLPLASTPQLHLQQGGLVADAHYQDALWLDQYDGAGNVRELHPVGGASQALAWNRETGQQIARLTNGRYTQFASTSFEPGATGRWYYDSTGTHVQEGIGRTGRRAYRLDGQGSTIWRDHLPAGEYVLSCWRQNGPAPTLTLINGQQQGSGWQAVTTAGGWTQYRTSFRITATGWVQIDGTAGLLDELRLAPATGQLTSYTHDGVGNLTSQTGPDGRTLFYEYDALGRLQRVRDEQGRILSENEYHYAPPQ